MNLNGGFVAKNVPGSGYPRGPVPSGLKPPENFDFADVLRAEREWHDMQDDVSTNPSSVIELASRVPHAL